MEKAKLNELIQRYVAMWHEPDAARRRETVVNLFTDDARDYTAKSVSKGIDEICARVKRAHDDWVAAKSFVFLPTENIDEHHNIVKFVWKMVPKDGGPVKSIGLDIFVLNDDGRIRVLYQFIEPNPS
jgi:hypothetical protein